MHVESLGLACSAIDSVQYDVNEGLHRNPGGKQICMYGDISHLASNQPQKPDESCSAECMH